MFKQPEVVLTAGPLSPPLETISGFSNTPLATPPLEDAPLTSPIVEYPAPVFSGQTPPLPIPLLLNTAHHLPFASSFRLTSPTNILATLGGNRVLELDVSQSLWDRMPYSAANAAAMVTTADANDEEQIETLLFADKPEARIRGFHWALRNHKSHEHLNTIFVHPPTPERVPTPPGEIPQIDLQPPIASDSTENQSSSITSRSPHMAEPVVNVVALPIPQVLPEVRSPPKRTIAMAADSLQLAQKRGRRPRLFGFTELPESAGSSAEGSRQASPERTPLPPVQIVHPASSPSSASSSSTIVGFASFPPHDFIPRRAPVRTKSETSLKTVSTLSKAVNPPRRRNNGLKLDFANVVPLASPSDLTGGVVLSPYSAKLIRKKSGEILKPALKYGGPLASNGTPLQLQREVSPSPKARFESKSCPSTPSCPKYVHFDAQLERVKLFMHDQKPQVVSREGSPTTEYTTSEGEEFPFPSTDEEKDERKVLQIKLPNFPTSHLPDTDLFLESLFLDDDRKSLRGIVQCRNIAFQKWVAIRFTFDWWQTTSEVTATHKDSVKGGSFDRFSFHIKLQDILSKIEEKTLFMAIRYNTDGREIWDANDGQNYQVQFEKVSPVPRKPAAARAQPSIQPGMGKSVGGRTSQWSVTGGNADDRLADLRLKLSRLTADDLAISPPQLSPGREARPTFAFSPSRRTSGSVSGFESPMGSPRRTFFSSFEQRPERELPVGGPALAARYDIGTALKTTREGRRSSNSPNSQAIDLPDVRTGLLQYGVRNGGQGNGRASMEFYSPRYSPKTVVETVPSNDYFFSPTMNTTSPATIDTSIVPTPILVPDVTVQGPSPEPTEDSTTPLPGATAAGKHTISRRPSLTRSITSPAKLTKLPDSALNCPPPHLDPSGSGSVTDTPSDSPRSPPDESLPRWSPTSRSEKGDDLRLASYSSFIEQFCWGGAAGSPRSSSSLKVKRSHSTSSLDHFFTAGVSTPRPLSMTPKNGDEIGGQPDTPSSGASFYTSFSTPTAREMEDVEEGLREYERSPIMSPGIGFGVGLGLVRNPEVAC